MAASDFISYLFLKNKSGHCLSEFGHQLTENVSYNCTSLTLCSLSVPSSNSGRNKDGQDKTATHRLLYKKSPCPVLHLD